jgi:hypothetical protein
MRSRRSARPNPTSCCWTRWAPPATPRSSGASGARPPQARVIVYSGYVSLLGEGELGEEADAYIEKSEDEEALVAMIRAVAAFG